MKRAGIAFCAGIEARRFDVLAQRDQTPFAVAVPPKQYTLENAYQLRVMIDLIRDGGIDLETAALIVNGATEKLAIHPLNQPESGGDLWIGRALVTMAKGDSTDIFYDYVGGFLPELFEQAQALVAEKYDPAEKPELVRIDMVNASQAARQVRERAKDLGLPEGEDFSLIFTDKPLPAWMVYSAEAE